MTEATTEATPKKFLTRVEASRYLTEVRGLPTAKGTLQKLATVGGGPPYQRFGNRTVYTSDNLDQWADKKISPPKPSTSDNQSNKHL
jgi:hypothetical protein